MSASSSTVLRHALHGAPLSERFAQNLIKTLVRFRPKSISPSGSEPASESFSAVPVRFRLKHSHFGRLICVLFISSRCVSISSRCGNSQVVPVYFALFTTAGVGSAAWVYYEFQCLADARQAVLFFMGILIAIMGVFLVSTGGTSKVQPADAQDVAMRKKGDVEMGEAGGDEGGAQHEQGYTAGLDEGSDVQGKDGSVSSHTREGPISGEASIPSTPLGPDGSSRRLAGIQCADTEVCGQGKGCSVDVHTPGTIRQVSGGQLSVQVEGDDVRSPPRGALLASAGALIQDGHHRHPPPTNYTPHLATQGVREATLPPQPDTGASASPCSRRRREKQMKEGRCGLNQLKPLPPLTSPNGGCAGAGSRFT